MHACLVCETILFLLSVSSLSHFSVFFSFSEMLNFPFYPSLRELSRGFCFAGWFCVSAAWNSQPFDLDNYTNANCLCPATSTGGRCQIGFYCPSGSSEPIPCPPGAFCNISGILIDYGISTNILFIYTKL